MNQATLNLEGIGSIELGFTERGSGRPVIVLHGGAGPFSVTAWAELLARTQPARVLTPTHPGFNGTARPERLKSVRDLARTYAAWLEQLGLEGVTLVGNSIGGWIAAELALLAGPRLSSLVIVDAAGIDVPGQKVVDVFSLTPQELSRLSFHDPVRFGIDPSKLPPEQKAMMVANRAVLQVYGATMVDASLSSRLAALEVPTLVVWGESDQVINAEFGRAYARAIPGARFELVPNAGHLPQIETPDILAQKVCAFVADHVPAQRVA